MPTSSMIGGMSVVPDAATAVGSVTGEGSCVPPAGAAPSWCANAFGMNSE
jgi:hypothetical protein